MSEQQLSYEAWRISFQSSEQAARAAFAHMVHLEAERVALIRRIVAAGDAIAEDLDTEEAYHQLYEALRDAGYSDLPGGTFNAARAALAPQVVA